MSLITKKPVTVQLICTFVFSYAFFCFDYGLKSVFSYAKRRLSRDVAHFACLVIRQLAHQLNPTLRYTPMQYTVTFNSCKMVFLDEKM